MECEFCSKSYEKKISLAAHRRFCANNPNKKHPMQGKTSWNKGLTKENSESIRIQAEKISKLHSDGILKPAGAAAASSEEKSKWAKNGKTGGYKENAGRSKKFNVKDSFGKETVLQSTYELECSLILNELGVRWIRPKSLKYDGKLYFADFYLVDYGIYLDPKNDYKAKCDASKIEAVIKQNNVKVFILTKDKLNAEYLQALLE